jgi:hypothetical protein
MLAMSARSSLLRIALILAVLLLPAAAAVAHLATADVDPERAKNSRELRRIIDEKIAFYNGRFPEIRFVHVDGGPDWPDDMVAVIAMLGEGADALDYEHSPNLREPLLEVTLERLRRFIRADVIAATMFRIGTGSVIKRPNLCVITLNPEAYFVSDYDATRYMLDLSPETMAKVHPGRYLDRVHHLEFAMDHEAFHCLDSYLNGGAPRTHQEFGAEYNMFRRESISDAFAMAMHLREHGVVTAYARNLVHARALWLFSDSPNACTFETIRELLRYDPATLRDTPMDEIIELASHVRNKTVGAYEAYVTQRASALTAAKQLGKGPEQYGEVWARMMNTNTNPTHVKFLINRYRYYYSQLFTDKQIPLEAPPISAPLHRTPALR